MFSFRVNFDKFAGKCSCSKAWTVLTICFCWFSSSLHDQKHTFLHLIITKNVSNISDLVSVAPCTVLCTMIPDFNWNRENRCICRKENGKRHFDVSWKEKHRCYFNINSDSVLFICPISPDSQPGTHITRALKLKQINRIQPAFIFLFTCVFSSCNRTSGKWHMVP